MKNRFQGKRIWITGGGSGLGRALALAFARQGAMIAVSGRRTDRLDEVVKEIALLGGQGLAINCDVTDESSIVNAANQIVEAFGQLDVSIANAAFSVFGPIEKHTVEDWQRQFETNVFGLAMTIKHSLPELRKTNGRMVLIASAGSMIASPKLGVYTSSKYAVRAIGQTLSMELHGSPVSCTTIHPGYFESEITQVDNSGVYRPNRRKLKSKWTWTSDRAAKACVKAIAVRKREYTFSFFGKLVAWLGCHTPDLVHFLLTRFGRPRKKKPS